MKAWQLLVILCTICSLYSCDSGLIFSQVEKINEDGWSYDAPLVFDLQSEDTTQYYELVVEIKHSKDFSFSNFYTKISTEFPDGQILSDIVSFQLADKMGSWIGNCSGKTCTNELILQDRFRFKKAGNHKMSIENYSRKELQGMKSIELKLYSIDKMK